MSHAEGGPVGRPPGSEAFVITEVEPTAENIARRGVATLRTVRDAYGDQGMATSPITGRSARYSLEQWKDSDADSTYLTVGFSYVDPAKVGTTLPPERRPDAVRGPTMRTRVVFDVDPS
jgi:hypothetical protein